MRKSIFFLLVLLMFFAFSSQAFAAGGPPSDVKKGSFIAVDPAADTAQFQDLSNGEVSTLTLGESINASDIEIDRKVMVSMGHEGEQEVVSDVSIMFLGMKMEKAIALLIVGMIGGLLSGFIGSGGAFVLTPAMMSLGVPGAIAVASNMCHKFPKAMVGSYKRFRYGQVDLKLGIFMAVSAIIGVQIGIRIQKIILDTWGSAGSDLYVSVAFVIILITVGAYVFRDALKLSKSTEEENKTPGLALKMQKIKIPPMITFKKAGIRLSFWVTVPVGLATGMLAATIAVGGFIGVPGMIYVFGATAMVASATELVVAATMGAWGSFQWALSGLIDIRLTLLILVGSLFGVQLGALGTTYVKDYVIKLVMGAVMLIVVISRGAKIPIYLSELGAISLNESTIKVLDQVSFWALVAALATAAIIITGAMIKGMVKAKTKEREETAAPAYDH